MSTTALKIEDASNETSNLMIEDHQNTTSSSTSVTAANASRYLIIKFRMNKDHLNLIPSKVHQQRRRQIQREMAIVNRHTAMSP